MRISSHVTASPTIPALPEHLAAIDLGSNSFHMVLARLVHGEIRTQEKMGEKVQLAAGLNADNVLSEEAQVRALECLGRFAQRLRGIVAQLPIEHLLLETDAPDQADAQIRGQRNEPARLMEILRVVAQLRDESEETIARHTSQNAMNLFGLVELAAE